MKNSIVTGGLQGIGRAIAHTLLARGDRVFVLDYIHSNDPAVTQLKEQGFLYFQTDVADVNVVKKSFASIESTLKNDNQHLDVLINNAGIARDTLVLRMTPEQWQSVLDVNLTGAFYCAQNALPLMMRNEKSYIINISSVVGIGGNAGQANYAASKAGLIALTKTLAQEYGKRAIMVNAIAPGFIATQMTKKLSDEQRKSVLQRIALKRPGHPEDVAHLVQFLTSGKADYITNEVITVSGGMF